MGILDSTAEEPHSKFLRYAITTVVFITLVAFGAWWLVRYHSEKQAVKYFLDTLAAGRTEQAYQIWRPTASYSYDRFLEDWGPNGYYGPVRSYRIVSAERFRNGSGVIVVAEISPYQPFPAPDDVVKESKTKEARIWVEFRDHSMSFPP